jgi:hypothetical protein
MIARLQVTVCIVHRLATFVVIRPYYGIATLPDERGEQTALAKVQELAFVMSRWWTR